MTARVFWQMNPGRNSVNLNWDAISADSVVMVSASEYNSNSQMLPDSSDQRFVGAADVTVSNVTPHGPPFDSNHGVGFVVEVGWTAPLTICTDIALISNAPDAVVYVGPQTQTHQTQTGHSTSAAVRTHVEARPQTERHYAAAAAAGAAMGSGTAPTTKTTKHEGRIG